MAHGSARSSSGTAATRAHVDRVRQRKLFHAVHAGFLFGAPSIEDALAAARAPSVHVVPFLMSDGAYAREVVPRRLGGDGTDTGRVRYGRPVGTHPGLAAIVSRRAGALCRSAAVAPAEATLVLVGHGSPRDRASARATHACAQLIRAGQTFANVRAVFLDERPSLVDMLCEAEEGHLVVAGFFADEGRHAGEDVRAMLGLGATGGSARRRGGQLLAYTGAIGADPAIADIILERALELTRPAEGIRRSA